MDKILSKVDFDLREIEISFVGEIVNITILEKLIIEGVVGEASPTSFSKIREEELIYRLFFRREKSLIKRLVDIVNLLKGSYSFIIKINGYKIKFIDFKGKNLFDKKDKKDKGAIIIGCGHRKLKIFVFEKIV